MKPFIQEMIIMFGLILTVLVYVAVITLAATATKHLVPQKPFDAR